MNNLIGIMVGMYEGNVSPLNGVMHLGLNACQVCCWDMNFYTKENAQNLAGEICKTKVKVTSLWAGWPGPAVWDFIRGPATLGLVPRRYREMRIAALKRAADFAKWSGIPAIVTHLGFIPENPQDKLFKEVVGVVREIALYCKRYELEFWFETGQETPITMLRLINETKMDNVGINLDPANLILYGKGNPIDALDIFGRYVKGIHAKDGLYPVDPMRLGREVTVGKGKVCFPKFIKRLNEIGYKGAFIIEREISGEQQIIDIKKTIKYLKKLLKP